METGGDDEETGMRRLATTMLTAVTVPIVDASGNILGALRTEVAAVSGKGFTSEAVALVDVNVRYVLRLLAKR
jgi:hypothetical protein